jgi:hypothetical protein
MKNANRKKDEMVRFTSVQHRAARYKTLYGKPLISSSSKTTTKVVFFLLKQMKKNLVFKNGTTFEIYIFRKFLKNYTFLILFAF